MQSIHTNVTMHQAGFRKNRSCADRHFALHLGVAIGMELVTLRQFSNIDYEKSFDGVARQCLWKLPRRHYGIPEKITSIIQSSYE